MHIVILSVLKITLYSLLSPIKFQTLLHSLELLSKGLDILTDVMINARLVNCGLDVHTSSAIFLEKTASDARLFLRCRRPQMP